MADEGELDLRALDDEELVKQMQDDLYDGLREEVEEGVNILLERDWTPYRVFTKKFSKKTFNTINFYIV